MSLLYYCDPSKTQKLVESLHVLSRHSTKKGQYKLLTSKEKPFEVLPAKKNPNLTSGPMVCMDQLFIAACNFSQKKREKNREEYE